MEVINGEFFMKGCGREDPCCLHSAAEAKELILEAGFLPLFENGAAGFSVEERVPAANWWTGDHEGDPWEWRMILARDPEIVYGKFFDKKAGFISREWFPEFANYRRNGYDFDALWEDELASRRMKRIMDVFGTEESVSEAHTGQAFLSFELKELAGFGKGGEKNFEGVLTDLQMHTYLVMCDFRQKVNRKGQPYGWHIAALEMPETKWGYAHVTSCYHKDPEESLDGIREQAARFFPEADREYLRKALALRRSGR
ncbi:MAG: hypothetical protein IJR62_02110 [Lachnospiraceae bacterium]|nr:hypothetical protein [Lachnospiraceae bacterium]